jgi:hypothetical protein
MDIELVKPVPGSERADMAPRKDEYFDRGERIIVVDGVRWERTSVSSHGVHGQKHTFIQEHGETLGEVSKHGYFHAFEVRSSRKRRWGSNDDFRPTLEVVLDKVKELISEGKLRDPATVKAERDDVRERMRAQASARQTAEEQEFKDRAMQATGINDPDHETVVRVVKAMRWAQSQ